MTLPNFFIVGAAKSGTTSMWRYLNQHPDVYMPDSKVGKEPAYYSSIYGFESRARYVSLFEGATDRQAAIGEASTAYLTDPSSPGRIAGEVPEARIIIMLRNPVDRAYSLYNWMTREGYEYASTFERALELEKVRVQDPTFATDNPQYYYNYLYYRSGRYHDQVKRYYKTFGKDQVSCILFQDFIEDTMDEYRKTCDFLNINPSFEPDLRVHNESKEVLYPPLQFILRKVINVANRIFNRTGVKKDRRDALLNIGLTSGRPPKMNPSVRDQLRDSYREDIEKLEQLLDRDLSSWYESS